MPLRVTLTLVLAVVFTLLSASVAFADLYYVSATEGELEAPSTRLSGVAADTWVLFGSREIYSLHLNSVYMWLDYNDYVEAGWAWYAGDGPEAYVAYESEGVEQKRVWLGPVQPGTWLHLQITNHGRDRQGRTLWECRVGDKRVVIPHTFTSATARVSSERQTYRDSDYGLFTRLQVFDDRRWRPWRHLRVQNGDGDYQGFPGPAGSFVVR